MRQVNVKLTEREHAWLRHRAAAAGMTPVEFGRGQLLAERPLRRKSSETAAHLDPLFLAHVARIGNNLNQLTRQCHLLRAAPPPTLEPLLQLVRDMLRKALPDGA